MARLISLVFAILGCTVAFGLMPSLSQAAVVWEHGGGGLTGALNVPVAGEALPYNISFSGSDLSCADVYGGCTSTTDLDTSSALLANRILDAVRSEILVDNPPAPFNYDTDPTLVAGCNVTPCWYAVPYRVSAGEISVVYIANFAGSPDPIIKIAIGGFSNTASANDLAPPFLGGDVQWVRFSVVPIPATLPLFMSCLAVFGFLARKRRATAAA